MTTGGTTSTAGRMIREEDELLGATGDEVANASRPAGAGNYRDWRKIWLPIPLIFLLFDVTFNLYFWQVPKLTGTSDDYGYQFLLDLRDLQTHRPQGVRVLAFGSSVTGAFDPYQIGGLLERDFPAQPIEVRRLLRPGTKPSDYHLLWASELEQVKPDIMVAVVNLVDFINPRFEQSLNPGVRYILPPWETLLARYDQISTAAEKIEMLLASVSNLYRYRKPIRSMVKDHVKLLSSWWRAGADAPYGVYPDGYAKPRFAVPVRPRLDYFVDPRWIEQRGRARVAFEYQGREIAREFLEPGWKSETFNAAENATELVHGTAEGGWSPRAAAVGDDSRLLGVRLREVPAVDGLDRNKPPLRYPPVLPTDINPFLRMGTARGQEYAERWRDLLEEKTDFGKRFRQYRKAKRARARQEFEPTAEFAELRSMVQEMAAHGYRVVIVNTPENPLLEDVVDSAFYADFLAYLESIAASDDRIEFVDLHDTSPPEDLNDWHHLNYIGQLKFGQLLARRLQPVVAAALSETARAH